jgi:hypothetical protein
MVLRSFLHHHAQTKWRTDVTGATHRQMASKYVSLVFSSKWKAWLWGCLVCAKLGHTWHMLAQGRRYTICRDANAPPKIWKNSSFDLNFTIYAPFLIQAYAPTRQVHHPSIYSSFATACSWAERNLARKWTQMWKNVNLEGSLPIFFWVKTYSMPNVVSTTIFLSLIKDWHTWASKLNPLIFQIIRPAHLLNS